MAILRLFLGVFGLALLTLAVFFKPTPKEWIVYQETPSFNIFVMQSDGSGVRQLTHETSVAQKPMWTGDGKWVVYGVQESDLRWYLHRTRFDGTHTERLVNRGFLSPPAMSPDGEWVAFGAPENVGLELFKVRVDGSDLQQLTTDGELTGVVHWSPDGEWIGYTSLQADGIRLYRIRADGSDLHLLTSDLWIDADFTWSPDGEWVAFASPQDQNVDIYRMRVDGSDMVRVTDSSAMETNPSWSPNGEYLTYFSGNVATTFERIRPDGTDQATITSDVAVNLDLSWSSDGRWVTFAGSGNTGSNLFRADVEKVVVEPLTNDHQTQLTPAWSPPLESAWQWRWFAYTGSFLVLLTTLIMRRRKSMDAAWESGNQTRPYRHIQTIRIDFTQPLWRRILSSEW